MLKSIPFLTRAVVFGGATIDRTGRSDAPAVLGASDPGTARALIGGVGLNVATILSRPRIPVAMVSRVGDDPDGERITAAALVVEAEGTPRPDLTPEALAEWRRAGH